jgi:hypothetical protein
VSAETVAVPLPSQDRLAQYWQSTKTAAKTIVVLLAIIGGAHVTEPLRADAAVAPAAVVSPAPEVVKSAGK